MEFVSYFKSEPNEYARMSVNGKPKKEGRGKSGFYFPFRTSIEVVSMAANDQGFTFNEVSSDKQEVALQGGFVFRVQNPAKVLDLYNMTIDPKTKEPLSEDAEKIPQHILQLVQAEARKLVQQKPLEELLVMSDALSEQVAEQLMKEGSKVADLGVELEMVYFSGIRPKPEIAKAWEAQYRDKLMEQQDESTYARRAKAVEKDAAIKRNEMAAKVELEEQRKNLVALEAENLKAEAEAKAAAAKVELEAFEGIEPEKLRALALYEMGKNAENIGTLTITPEILAGLKG